MAAIHRPRPIVPRHGFCRGGGAVVLHHHLPDPLAARSGRNAEPDECLSVLAGAGDASPADAASLRERAWPWRSISKPIRWSTG